MNHLSSKLTIVVLMFVCSESAFGQRTWQSSNGKFKVEAKLIGHTKETVKLETTDDQIIDVPIAKLSQADREYIQSEIARENKEQQWETEFKELGEVVSMSYRVGKKFQGISFNDSNYLRKTENLRRRKFENNEFGIHALAMSEILIEKARWERVAAGRENAEPLTAAQIDQRLRSIGDAFNAGLGDEGAKLNMVDHFTAMYRELKQGQAKAAQNQKLLDKELFKRWESLTRLAAANSGPETDRPLFDLQYESTSQSKKFGGSSQLSSELIMINRSKSTLTNVVLKIRSKVCSGYKCPKTYYIYVASWRPSKKIEFPPGFYDTILSSANIGDLNVSPGQSVVTASVWCKELSREDIEINLRAKPKSKSKTVTKKRNFGFENRSVETTITAEFSDQ